MIRRYFFAQQNKKILRINFLEILEVYLWGFSLELFFDTFSFVSDHLKFEFQCSWCSSWLGWSAHKVAKIHFLFWHYKYLLWTTNIYKFQKLYIYLLFELFQFSPHCPFYLWYLDLILSFSICIHLRSSYSIFVFFLQWYWSIW